MEEIKKKVEELISLHNTSDPFKIAQHRGIEIKYGFLGKASGYYEKLWGIQTIHINEALNFERQLFVGAHELAHAILHEDIDTAFMKEHTFFEVSKIEKEAHFFAFHLLFNDLKEIYLTEKELKAYGFPRYILSDFF